MHFLRIAIIFPVSIIALIGGATFVSSKLPSFTPLQGVPNKLDKRIHSSIDAENIRREDDNRRKKSLWPKATIPVCWVNGSSKYAQRQKLVQDAITNTWQSASGLKFTGWCDCKSFQKGQNNGVRILIKDDKPKTFGFGFNISNFETGMILNLDFKNISVSKMIINTNSRELEPTSYRPKKEVELKALIRAESVHEFGHAIGFRHSNSRNDCTFKCFYDNEEEDKDAVWSTSCSDYSVMNYCNDKYLNDGYLTDFDIISVQDFYPAHNKSNDSITIEYVLHRHWEKPSMSYSEWRKAVKDFPPQRQSISPSFKETLPQRKTDAVLHIKTLRKLKYPIAYVEYWFHRPTFSDAAKTRRASNQFAVPLEEVWGNFACEARVHFVDSSSTMRVRYIYAISDKVERSGIGNRIRDSHGKSYGIRMD